MSKVLTILLSLFLLCSCSNKPIYEEELFSYYYDYQFYGFDIGECSFKATTVSTLKAAIDNKNSAIFLISTPSCISCMKVAEIVNEIALDNDLNVYNIDSNSTIYPVFDTENFDVLLDILKDIGINSEDDFVLPILLIINKGNISDYYYGYDYHNTMSDDELISIIKSKLS